MSVITNLIKMFKEHPRGFWFIFWGEFAERASFYGMKTLLVFYMIDVIKYNDANSSTIASLFSAAAYALPILGGIIADRWLGKFKTIIYFAIPYIMGHIILGTFDNKVGLFVALALLAGGSGAIKPNISTLMGLMYDKAGKRHLMSQAFSYFYFAINLGAFLTSATLPRIRTLYSYEVAFIAPTVLMVVSLGIFYLGKKYYPVENMKEIRNQNKSFKTPEQRIMERKIIWRILGLFSLIIFFWSIFDQSYSTWTLFARDYLNLETFIGKIDADALQSANPILILIITPLFAWFFTRVDKSEKYNLTGPRKMLIGFVLVIICMGVMSIAGFLAVHERISMMWEIASYVLITMAEVCISITGLQLAYEEAPHHMKSFITGLWLVTISIADVLAGLFARVYTKVQPGEYFAGMTVMIAIVTIAFYFVGRKFDKQPGALKQEYEKNFNSLGNQGD